MTSPLKDVAEEAAKILDCMAVLQLRISPSGRTHQAVRLAPGEAADFKAAVAEAIAAARKIFEIAGQHGESPLPTPAPPFHRP
jgi:hypothetical protein